MEGFAIFETKVHHIQRGALDFLKSGFGERMVESFRTYGSFSLVMSSALLVTLTNVAHERGTSAIFGYLGKDDVAASSILRKHFTAETTEKTSLSLVPLSAPLVAVDLSKRVAEGESVSFQNGALLSAQADNAIVRDPEEEGGVSIYTVAEGDTVSGIATKHGITVNTILWANDLDNVDSIKPGDQIFILPVAGLSHVVASGDTIDSIAAKYKADREKIIAYNGLPANGEISVGESIVIPGGYKELPKPAEDTSGLARRQYASSSSDGAVTDVSGGYKKLDGKAGAGHRFPYGYCTWYVSQKRYVPWGGNAGTWLFNARSMGYRTGKIPARGAIVVTTENRYYGHVAIVESVSAGSITVSEMNYKGWGKTNRRVIPISSRAIKGYIY
jgi:surface antigen